MEGFAVIIAGSKKYAVSFLTPIEAKPKEEYTIAEIERLIMDSTKAIHEALGMYEGKYTARVNFEGTGYWLDVESKGAI